MLKRQLYCNLRGFDDSLIRVDKYGNVLYRLAEPGSPLYGQIDHWFPVASEAS